MEKAISAGWNVNSPTGINNLPALEFAFYNNQSELVALLLSNGAKIGNALEIVKRAASALPGRDYTKVLQLLSAHQATLPYTARG